MKKTLALIALIFLSFNAISQTVENIRVEQDGDKLNIHYRIGGSTSSELYFVTLTCSIDGGPPFEPKSVIGDVGSNIRGGKSFNTIVWDVFSDLEEIGEVEFFVKVDLEKDESMNSESTPGMVNTPSNTEADNGAAAVAKSDHRKFMLMLAGSSRLQGGGRIAYLGDKWGVYGSARAGYDWVYYEYDAVVDIGVTRPFKKEWNNFRMQYYAGIGSNSFLEVDVEAGVMGIIKNRLVLLGGLSVFSAYPDVTFGLGLVF